VRNIAQQEIDKSKFESQEIDLSSDDETCEDFFVIHGGMDTEGNIFDDFYLIKLL
jgi:hypothetical protein